MITEESTGRLSVGRSPQELVTLTDTPASALVSSEHHQSSSPSVMSQQQHYTQLETPAHLQTPHQYYYQTRAEAAGGGAIVSALQYGTSTVSPPESITPPGHNVVPQTWSPSEQHTQPPLPYASPSLARTYSPYAMSQQHHTINVGAGATSGMEPLPHGSPRPGELAAAGAPTQSYPSPVGLSGRGGYSTVPQYGSPVSPAETKVFAGDGLGHDATSAWQVQQSQMYGHHHGTPSDSHLHHATGHHQAMSAELQHPATLDRGKIIRLNYGVCI